MALDLESLERSYDIVSPRAEEVDELFHRRLFDAAPALMPLLARLDRRRRRAVLLAGLVLVRTAPRDIGALVPGGRERAVSGAAAEARLIVACAVVRALADVAGDAWQPRFAQAWAAAYPAVADAILEGAEAEALAAAA